MISPKKLDCRELQECCRTMQRTSDAVFEDDEEHTQPRCALILRLLAMGETIVCISQRIPRYRGSSLPIEVCLSGGPHTYILFIGGHTSDDQGTYHKGGTSVAMYCEVFSFRWVLPYDVLLLSLTSSYGGRFCNCSPMVAITSGHLGHVCEKLTTREQTIGGELNVIHGCTRFVHG